MVTKILYIYENTIHRYNPITCNVSKKIMKILYGWDMYNNCICNCIRTKLYLRKHGECFPSNKEADAETTRFIVL